MLISMHFFFIVKKIVGCHFRLAVEGYGSLTWHLQCLTT